MAHLKRHKVPKIWGIPRKGTTFVVTPNFSPQNGVPILVALRDMLKIAQNRKEVKKAIHLNNLLLNTKPVTDEKNTIVLFDVLTLVPSKKHFRLDLNEKGKFVLLEIKEAESKTKIVKIVNKKTLKAKKTQLNFGDGKNLLSETKCKTNDSVVINFKDKKIEKCLELKEKAKVLVFGGKHAGEIGIVNKIDQEMKMADLSEKGKHVHVLIKQLMVIE